MQLSKIKEYLELVLLILSLGPLYLTRNWGLDNCEITLLVVCVLLAIVWVYVYRRGYKLLSFPAIILTVSILVICISAWGWFHRITPFGKDKIGIYVARFEGDYGTAYREEIFQAIKAAIERAGLSQQVMVCRLQKRIYGDEGSFKALEYGHKGNAKLVIWGSFTSDKKVRAWVTCTEFFYYTSWRIGPEGEIILPSDLLDTRVPEDFIKEPLILINFVVAVSLAKKGKHKEAILQLQEVLETKIDFADAHFLLGDEYKSEGDYENAVLAYKKATDLSIKQKTDLCLFSGIALAAIYLQEAKDADKAVETLKEILKRYPNSPDAHLRLGMAYAMKRMFPFAKGEIETAIDLFPDLAEAHLMLGAIYHDEGKYDEALLKYNKVREINPHYTVADIDIWIVKACAKKGNFEVAVDTWKNTTKQEPDYIFYYRLGLAYYEDGQSEEAIKTFKKVIEIKPDYFFTYVSLGSIYFRQGQLKEAIQTYLKLQELRRKGVVLDLATELFLFGRRLIVSDKNLMEKMRGQVSSLNWEERGVANKLLTEPTR